jgi:chromosome segregation ATPase
MDKVKDEWIVNNLLISDITTLPLNVFTQVNSFTGNIFVRVFFQTEGGFLGSSGSSDEAVTAASKFVRNYAVELYREAVAKEVKEEEKKLTNLENDLSRLLRQNKNFDNKISDAQKEEMDLKNEVLQNEELLRNQQNIIQVDSGNPGTKTVQEQLEKQVKETEKDLEKTQKSQFKYDKKLSKNEREQKDKIFEIDRQKIRVDEVRKKLDNIK